MSVSVSKPTAIQDSYEIAPGYGSIYVIVFSAIELFALSFGQKKQTVVLNILTYASVLITVSSIRKYFWIFALVLGVAGACDMISYFSFEREADTSFLAIFRWEDVNQIPLWLFLSCASIIIFFVFSLFYKWNVRRITVPAPTYLTMYFVSGLILSVWLKYHFHVFFPFTELSGATISPKLVKYFSTPARVFTNGTRKNVMILMLESMELEFVGKYSSACPGNMPFMENISESGFFNENIHTQKYVDYTAGGLFAQTCGLPLIRAQTGTVSGNTPILTNTYHCLGDYLRLAGYTASVHSSAETSHHLDTLYMKQFGDFHQMDEHYHDWELFDVLKKKTLPELMNQPKPWVLYIETFNSHLFDNFFDSEHCKVRFKCPPAHMAHDCTSTFIEDFLNYADSIGALNNTEIVIFGDHRHAALRGLTNQYKMRRKMGFWIPTAPSSPELRTKEGSPYDTAPTILDLLEIKYEPEFPWGASLLSDKVGDVPTNYDFAALFNYWSKLVDLPFNMQGETGWRHALV